MKLHVMAIFIFVSKESKRKFQDIEISPDHHSKIQNEDILTHDHPINNVFDLLPPSSTEFNQSPSKLGKCEESDLEEFFFDGSDNISVAEGAFTPDQMDLLVIERLKSLEVNTISSHFGEHRHHDINDVYEDLPGNEISEKDNLNAEVLLKENNFKYFKKYTLKTFIENFIKAKIPISYASNHQRNVYNIERACIIYEKHKLDIEAYYLLLNHLFFKKLLNVLKKIILTFGTSFNFNKDVCKKFLEDFNLEIYTRQDSEEIRCELNKLPNNQKILFYYKELMKLYKYVADIPEILTLGGLFSEFSFRNTVFIMHLMNIFAENVENIKDIKVLMLFMISRIFKCFYSYQFDIFRLPIYKLECDKDSHNLDFFLWDLNVNKKHDIKRRKNVTLQYEYSDKVYFKAVFYIFLYQHSIYVKYYDKSSKEIKSFQDFIDKVTQSKDCVACLFNEYLSKLRDKTI